MKDWMEVSKRILFVITVFVTYIGYSDPAYLLRISQLSDKYKFGEMLVMAKENNNGVIDNRIVVIDEYLKKKDSPLFGLGKMIADKADKYAISPYLLVAIMGAESGFGKYGYAAQGTYNAVGLGIHEGRKYNSWEEGIDDFGYVLKNYYFDENRVTPKQIQDKWAPRGIDGNGWDDTWANNVSFFLNELELTEKEIS